MDVMGVKDASQLEMLGKTGVRSLYSLTPPQVYGDTLTRQTQTDMVSPY